jgi:hypothetical protein
VTPGEFPKLEFPQNAGPLSIHSKKKKWDKLRSFSFKYRRGQEREGEGDTIEEGDIEYCGRYQSNRKMY